MLIAIDHGNYAVKTPSFSFVSGLSEHTVKPPLTDEIIEYAGRYWTLSGKRLNYMRDKTRDERYFILSLFAIAKELEAHGSGTGIQKIDLSIGLPPEHYGALKEKFADYFKNRDLIKFVYKVEQVEGATSKYLNQNWASGNVFISKLYVGEPDDKWEKYDEFNKSATKSLTLGFFPEVKMINDKILACQGAAAEFTGLLSCGAVDPDEYLPKLKSSLEASGVNDVVEELQKQYDEWSKN